VGGKARHYAPLRKNVNFYTRKGGRKQVEKVFGKVETLTWGREKVKEEQDRGGISRIKLGYQRPYTSVKAKRPRWRETQVNPCCTPLWELKTPQ